MAEQEKHLLYKIKPFLANSQIADGVDVGLSGTDTTGLLEGAGSVEAALSRLDNTGIGAPSRTFTGNFLSTYSDTGNQDIWYGGRQSVSLETVSSQSNGHYTYEVPDSEELTSMFDDMETRGVAQRYTLTLTHRAGASSSVVNNALTISAPSVSVGFPVGTFPTTIPLGVSAVFRVERIGSTITQWEKVSVQQSVDPVAVFGDVVLQSTPWNNMNGSMLPPSNIVQKGYAFPVSGSSPNDGSLRQGLLDSGVGDRFIYDGDYVLWTADSFSSWTNGDDWLVLSRNDLQRMSREESNFLSQVTEIDNRVDVGFVSNMNAEANVWLSESPFVAAPFLTPSTDTNNPRGSDDYRYIGGRENKDSFGQFTFNQNRFGSYLTIGISPSFLVGHDPSDIYVYTREDGDIVSTLNLGTDFVMRSDGDFSNSSITHFTRPTSSNYGALEVVSIVLTSVQRHFRLNSNTVDTTENVQNLREDQLDSSVQEKLNATFVPTDDSARFEALEPRLSPLENIRVTTPYTAALFLDNPGSGPYPSDLSIFTEVSLVNPRFTAAGTDVYVAVVGDTSTAYTVKNTTQDTETPLVQVDVNVDVVESISYKDQTWFVYAVSGLTPGDLIEVDSVALMTEAEWAVDIEDLQENVSRIDAELKHAALHLSDALVNVLDNEVTVSEEDLPSVGPSEYNSSLSTDGSQTIFLDEGTTTDRLISSIMNPKAGDVTDLSGNKLLYVSNPLAQDTVVLSAWNGVTGTRLIQYTDNQFFGKQFVPSIPAGSTSVTEYVSRSNGEGAFASLPIVVNLGSRDSSGNLQPIDTAVSLTENVPTDASTVVTVAINGVINGNDGGQQTLSVPYGGSDVLRYITSGGFDTGVRVTALYRNNNSEIELEVVDELNNQAVEGGHLNILATYTSTRVIPSTPATVRDVLLTVQNTGKSTVFSVNQGSNGNLVIQSNSRVVDTGYSYDTLFSPEEAGVLRTSIEAIPSQFMDFRVITPSSLLITELENHSVLPQYGLFETDYTHKTVVDLGTQLVVRDSNGVQRNVGDVLSDLLTRIAALE